MKLKHIKTSVGVSEDLNTITDHTTTTGYMYLSENLRPEAVASDADWRISKVNKANGDLCWANGSSDFNKVASNAANETYTYRF